MDASLPPHFQGGIIYPLAHCVYFCIHIHVHKKRARRLCTWVYHALVRHHGWLRNYWSSAVSAECGSTTSPPVSAPTTNSKIASAPPTPYPFATDFCQTGLSLIVQSASPAPLLPVDPRGRPPQQQQCTICTRHCHCSKSHLFHLAAPPGSPKFAQTQCLFLESLKALGKMLIAAQMFADLCVVHCSKYNCCHGPAPSFTAL